MNYNPSYTLQPSSSPSEPLTKLTESPPPANAHHHHLPPLPIPASFNNHKNSYPRQGYPTSSPYQQSSPESPSTKIRLPPPTSLFTNGYASPALSSYSSEPGSRDEMEMTDSETMGGSLRPGIFPGVDSMLRDGMQLEKHSPRGDYREHEWHRRWSMRDFNLVQTVGISIYDGS
jgi:hypothetical protein